MWNTFLSLLFVLLVSFPSAAGASVVDEEKVDIVKPSFYTAAVFEHAVSLPTSKATSYEEAVEQMMVNLAEYEKQAIIAGNLGVDLLVFPEDGIYGMVFSKPADVELYLEYIPDPGLVDWTPCDDPSRFNRTFVQSFLSCLAKNNSLYLIANYGDVQPCSFEDPNCPTSGQYQYNTNIVFDRTGKLIARYHKQHLFYEDQFNAPVNPEVVYFDTEFGRFGMFTCFDILFHDPAMRLVHSAKVTDVIFPTAWMDALPYFSAIGYHSSFAVGYNVNLLAANLHIPTLDFQGSGIYTPSGPIDFYYNKTSWSGRLLVGNVPVISRRRRNADCAGTELQFQKKEMSYYKEPEFKAVIFHDWYDMVPLQNKADNITVCQHGLCCHLSYEFEDFETSYSLGVFNGIHKYQGQYYLQVCIVVNCWNEDSHNCAKPDVNAHGMFEYLRLTGSFSTPFVTPQMVLSDMGSLQIPPKDSWTFDTHGITSHSTKLPLFEATLLGRVYVSD